MTSLELEVSGGGAAELNINLLYRHPGSFTLTLPLVASLYDICFGLSAILRVQAMFPRWRVVQIAKACSFLNLAIISRSSMAFSYVATNATLKAVSVPPPTDTRDWLDLMYRLSDVMSYFGLIMGNLFAAAFLENTDNSYLIPQLVAIQTSKFIIFSFEEVPIIVNQRIQATARGGMPMTVLPGLPPSPASTIHFQNVTQVDPNPKVAETRAITRPSSWGQSSRLSDLIRNFT
ncbi:hypothetical protein BDK51DRAFT_36813 [Blyttiomyces helicus]|uniref:Uncharacterized protein n=1 Tax=Blyttiomyces helicus TaxID=388810 RepID=A0A4P9W586_9FUNG|nr:hypothetical protein BDK51DRAFT_36813 [Blyttiomyces helicus]|eukprot:RKO86058.1 hypothetical protein BDK51DRAFT_36813 [Blyttiomyces helicus]